MEKRLLTISFVLITFSAFSQNLVPNPGFEDVFCPDNVINSITKTDTWYGTAADAYWIHVRCPFDPAAAQAVNVLDQNLNAKTGLGYVALESLLWNNGFFVSEGIGIELKRSLKPQRFYFFEMAFLNFETIYRNNSGKDETICGDFPIHALEVRIGRDTIETDFTSDITVTPPLIIDNQTNGMVKLVNELAASSTFKTKRWRDYWSCFQADGGENHLAVLGNNYQIDLSHPCVAERETNLLYHAGHALDDIQLVEIPLSVDTTLVLCNDNINIDLKDLVYPSLARRATFRWLDGTPGEERVISTPGLYKGEMEFPCTTVPINIAVDKEICETKVFMPDAFSPNRDGINDELKPFFSAQLEIQSYRFAVYNRWGNLVYQTMDMNQGWDGWTKEKRNTGGLYMWTLEYTLGSSDSFQKVERLSGEVLLMH
ncbi:MAG: gliding motility-associated C-terminal domain-containing protein [Bacteroidota bacterium]